MVGCSLSHPLKPTPAAVEDKLGAAGVEGTCITRAKYEKIPHELSTLAGIQEPVHDIFMNLKEIVLRRNLYGPPDASFVLRELMGTRFFKQS
ncbi:unnamed protein product [Linum trigynum]|uniref:Uncharacterized protein n=1 Tax=Linum trigynum TaxID=586398 RepID=A0AAV2F189_9ROSI